MMSSLEVQKRKVDNLKLQIATAEKETAAKFHKIDVLNSQIKECKDLAAKGGPVPAEYPKPAAPAQS